MILNIELAIKISVIIHVLAGAVALLSGVVAMIAKKGNKVHILLGRVYVYAMTIIFVTAMFLSIAKMRWFLFFIGVFSFYQVIVGYRALGFKRSDATLFDKILSFIVLVGSLVAFVYGLISGVILFIIFGVLGAALSSMALYRFFSKEKDKMYWIKGHIAGMLGAFIATSTAFLITVMEAQLGIWTWILPTIIGTPLIVYYLRQYKIINHRDTRNTQSSQRNN